MGDAAAAEAGDLIGGAEAPGEAKPEAEAKPDAEVTPEAEAKPEAEAEAKPKVEDKPAEPVVPEKYDLKAPEGTTLAENLVDAATPLFKENKWSNETAQQAIEIFSKVREAEVAGFETMKANDDTSLRKALGDEYEPTQRRVGALLTAFKAEAGDEAHAALVDVIVEQHGLGSNAVMVRLLDWMAKGLKSEDSIAGTASGATGDNTMTEKERLAKKYPSMHDEDGNPKS